MAIVFPASPSVNDTFTEGSITYKWDGAKWIGLGVTPADRLIEGSNSLEIDASNNLVWSGGNVGIGTGAPISTLHVQGTFRSAINSGVGGDTLLGAINGVSNGYLINVDTSNNITHTWHTGGNVSALSIINNANVGIGQTNPSKKLDVKIPDTSSGTRYVAHFGGSNHLTGYAIGIGLDPEGYGYRNKIGILAEGISQGWSRGKLHFALHGISDSTEASIADAKMTILESGNVGIGTTNPTAKLHVNGSIKVESGIDFSSNANAAGMTSELLDDYEEGTWTPQATQGITGTPSYSIQVGWYTKIGRIVTLYFYIRFGPSGNTGSNSIFQVGNLPFPVASVNNTTLMRGMGVSNYHSIPGFTSANVSLYGGGSLTTYASVYQGNTPVATTSSVNSEYIIGGFEYISE